MQSLILILIQVFEVSKLFVIGIPIDFLKLVMCNFIKTISKRIISGLTTFYQCFFVYDVCITCYFNPTLIYLSCLVNVEMIHQNKLLCTYVQERTKWPMIT